MGYWILYALVTSAPNYAVPVVVPFGVNRQICEETAAVMRYRGGRYWREPECVEVGPNATVPDDPRAVVPFLEERGRIPRKDKQ